VVEMRNITKRFPRVTANDAVSLHIRRGQVHALVGENGAGKTTLMNVLYGLLKPDAGEVIVRGQPLPLQRGFLGLDYGIGMIHQHFMLVGRFSALENIILGAEPRAGLLLDIGSARQKVKRLMEDYGIEVDLDARIDDLSVGEEQRVEIIKVLYRDADIIIMDEPTAVLTPQEARHLFSTLGRLVSHGKTVVFITHKLEEVMEAAQTVTVMRAGRVIDTAPTSDTDIGTLAEMMVGRTIEVLPERTHRPAREPLLEAESLSMSRKGQRLLSDICLTVRCGEILGICGVDGNGQDELFEVLTGLSQPDSGRLLFKGRDITPLSTSERFKAGLAHIPPDRARMGLVGEFSVQENLILGRHSDPHFSGRLFLRTNRIRGEAARLVNEFCIEPSVPAMRAGLLSGGNQQKIIVARELSRDPDLLIAAQPARGLDVGAARMIHRLLVRQAEEGKSVLLISADLSEIMSLSDRIAVMYRGRIVGVVDGAGASEDELGLMMAGVRK
jgi:simple sugar transport system ATP-binding protein